VLRWAWRLDPGDFWINFDLAQVHSTAIGYDRPEEAVRFFSAAIAIRPRGFASHNNLGVALKDQGKLGEAVAAYREALRLKPDLAEPHNNLGGALNEQGKLEEAVTEYREAIRLRPGLATSHTYLGAALADQGKLEQAIAEHREALRLDPDCFQAHFNLGEALRREAKFDEAIAECREAIRLIPDIWLAHNHLGATLSDQGKLEDAIAEYREALRLKPDSAEAHGNLGSVLQAQGKLDEALAAFRRAARHARPGSPLARDLPAIIQRLERRIALSPRLPAILRKEDHPNGAAEGAVFARLCYDRGQHGNASRLWAEAFQGEPKLSQDMQAQNRYQAACAAALAGSGKGKDDPPEDEAAKARWRKQAVDWLQADLAFWTKQIETGSPQARQFVAKTLQHWKADPDLAGIRDPAALAKLPVDEQNACRALWAEVDTTLRRFPNLHAPVRTTH
jgi:tetratricopeptide (TPR) repeat protein